MNVQCNELLRKLVVDQSTVPTPGIKTKQEKYKLVIEQKKMFHANNTRPI